MVISTTNRVFNMVIQIEGPGGGFVTLVTTTGQACEAPEALELDPLLILTYIDVSVMPTAIESSSQGWNSICKHMHSFCYLDRGVVDMHECRDSVLISVRDVHNHAAARHPR